MPIVINGSAGTVTGIATGGLPDGCVDTDTLANNAVTSAKSTGLGITMADQWRVTSTFNVSSSANITNWERNDSPGFAKIGTGMSVDGSGHFSFPSTGIYLVKISLTGNSDGGPFNYVACDIETTLNNSSYTGVAATYQAVEDSNHHWHMATEILFDVTDVSTHKVQFKMYSTNTRPYVYGSSAHNATYAHFTKLGET